MRERRALFRRRIGLVEVVEHRCARMRQRRVEVAEEAACEAREILLWLRREERQRRRLFGGETLRSGAEKVEERRGVRVARVELIPEMTPLARFEPARDQRGLARARG